MQEKSNISLSIAVVCYHSTSEELYQLFESVLSSVECLREKFDCETIPFYLIDNSETDELNLDMFSSLGDEATRLNLEPRLLKGHGNIGYGRAHNLPLSKIESEYHLILNPDIVLDTNCIASGVTFLKETPDAVLATPQASDHNGDKQYLCKRYPSVLTFLLRGFFPKFIKNLFSTRLSNYEMQDLDEQQANKDIPIASGCFMLCRTESLKNIEGFDENYFLYFEDFALSMRIGRQGKIAYVPCMKIIHSGGHAAKKGLGHIKMFVRSGIRFFNTHGWRWIKQ